MDEPRKHRLDGYAVSESAVCIENSQDPLHHRHGSGVVISPRHIATCAHVVLDALGLPHDQTDAPNSALSVTIWRQGKSQLFNASILPQWKPAEAGDVAVLELHKCQLDLLPACSRVIHSDQWSIQGVEVMGYPQDFEAGQWVNLQCHNPIGSGYIQCSPGREGISPGYSGGPVFNTNGDLLAIARSTRRFSNPDLKFDYLIPVNQILEMIPVFSAPRRQPYFSLSKSMAHSTDASVEPNQALTDLMDEARRTPSHTLPEYRLLRQVRDWQTQAIRLDFTPLLLVLDERRRHTELGQGPEPIPRNNLGEVLQKDGYPVFLLKGAPGGGKSTLLKRLALDLCSQDEHNLLPILIELSGHKGNSRPGEWLEQYWQDNFGDMQALPDLMQAQPILWLLDGLNELPDESAVPRVEKIGHWRDWLARLPEGHRVIISCRSADYLNELDTVGDDTVPHLELQPLDLKKIGEFLNNRSSLTSQQAQAAHEHIKNRDLVQLYSTPLMLTLLEQVLSAEGNFPDGRADLFDAFVIHLVNRELGKPDSVCAPLFTSTQKDLVISAAKPSSEEAGPPSARRFKLLRSSSPLFNALASQAYQRQKTEYRGERQEVSFDRLSMEEALGRFDKTGSEGQVLKAALALNLLVITEDGHNLRFMHQQFQEFFAARELAAQGDLRLAVAPHQPADFRQSLDDIRSAMQAWQELPGVDRSGWEETTLMAAELADKPEDFVTELAQFNLPLAGQCAATLGTRYNAISSLAVQLLARMRDDNCDLRARIAAGKALGDMQALEVLGYTSLNDSSGQRVVWLPPTGRIDGGEYCFGSRNDPDADDDEHRFTECLDTFHLARYAVTNAEWGCFMQAGGYAEKRFWPGKIADNFRQQGSMEGQVVAWENWRKWSEDGSMQGKLEASSWDPETQALVRRKTSLDSVQWQKHLSDLRSKAEPVTEPGFWRQQRFSNALQPVVGISLFEALAYCCWLSELTGEHYSLPHELQWEAAARGAGAAGPRRYAWGDGFAQDRCNSRDAQDRIQVGATTPVGLYQDGRTPGTELYDVTGNIWEWTTSVYRSSPPYDAGVLEQLEDSRQSRVVRGGAWDGDPRYVRAAYRSYNVPGGRNSYLGCRVCLLPPPES